MSRQRPRQSARVIRLDHLVGNHNNPRNKLRNLTDLQASIAEQGIVEPLVVTEHPTELDRWLIVAGHRRAAAARAAGLVAVPCVVRHNVEEDDEQLLLMLIENCLRDDLGPMEKAEAFGTLRAHGFTVAEIARRTGLSAPTISYHLTLLDLDPDSRERVRCGQVQVGHARQAVRSVRRQARATGSPARRSEQLGRPVVAEPAHFTKRHPLASTVRAGCTHTQRPRVGGVGCGQCWEAAIRADASADLAITAA